MTYQGCGLIKDPVTGRFNVLVTGGVSGPLSPTSPDVSATWIWDPITGQIKALANAPTNLVSGNSLKVVEYSDYENLVLQPDTGIIYKFSVANGWTPIANLGKKIDDPAFFLVPKGLFTCL